MSKISKCIVRNKMDGMDEEQIRKGLRRAGQIYKELGGGNEVALIVPNHSSVSNEYIRNALNKELGDNLAEILRKSKIGEPIREIEDGGYLILWTHSTFCRAHPKGLLIALYPSKGLLQRIDGHIEYAEKQAVVELNAVVVILARQQDESAWIRRWNPEIINNG